MSTNPFDNVDLKNLSVEDVKKLKNAAIERLKAAGQMPLEQMSHQNSAHQVHSNHVTHSTFTSGF